MPWKCSGLPDTSCYVYGEMTFKLTGEILPRSLRNVMSFILGVKWVLQSGGCNMSFNVHF